MDSQRFSNVTIKLKGVVDMNTLMKLFDMLEKVEQVQVFLFDMSSVKTLTSTGVSKILELVEKYEREGKKFAFINLNKQVQIVFSMMGVEKLLRIFKDADDALNNL